ncbi:rRNA biogenesis protein RRP5-like protein [Drosera capensis]
MQPPSRCCPNTSPRRSVSNSATQPQQRTPPRTSLPRRRTPSRTSLVARSQPSTSPSCLVYAHNSKAFKEGGKTVEVGSSVRAMVLDISKAERLVDLSLKLEFVERLAKNDSEVQSSKKKRKKVSPKDLKVHATVTAIVEIVKEEYLVLSLPDHDYAIGYAAVSDYNIQNLTHGQFSSGQRVGSSTGCLSFPFEIWIHYPHMMQLPFKMDVCSVVATIMSLPSPSTAGRLLLFLESTQPAEAFSSKRSKRKSGYDVGALVEAEQRVFFPDTIAALTVSLQITEIMTLELRLKFGNGLRGRVHITEVADVDPDGNPFSCYKVGQKLAARILANYTPLDSHKKGYHWELSLKPSVLAGTSGTQDDSTKELNYAVAQRVSGYVYKVDNNWVWLAVSRHVNAQLFVLDSSSELDELQEFSRRFKLGDIFSGYILNINADKRLLRLVMHKFPTSTNEVASEDHKNSGLGTEKSPEKVVLHIHEGDVVGGRIWKILPGVGGLLVQLGPHLSGKVHFTEISDTWVPNPLSSYQEGQFVKCKVLEVSNSLSGTVHVDLSLRSTLEGLQSGTSGAILKGCTAGYRAGKIEDLHPNMAVKGYVKNVSSKGCFIMLARNIDAKVLLGNLCDGFVKDPIKEFPVGKLVEGKVLSVDPSSKRVEVTLKTSDNTGRVQSETVDLSSVHVGDVMSGIIKRVEPYGLFIRLDDTNIVGLCHVSELSDDDHVSGADKQHKAGERVRAKVLKLDKERQRVALGMKASYFNNSPEESDEGINGSTGNVLLDSQDVPSLASDSDTECEVELESSNVHSKLGSSVPPLEVQLDDADDSVMDSVANLKVVDGVDAANEKRSRQEKRKAREEREREIRAAEERLLEGDIPRTSDEFEKLIRSSPNNSFVWIKYMSFKIDSADVEGARSVAERALDTINMTHEAEKLHIWVAYLNLENEFGNPREEAVKGIFRRALQFCDPMKIHMELLGLYERTCQNELAGQLLEIMVKKFRNSMEEIRVGDVDLTRSLFERATSLSLSAKKMKFLFKKYLNYEKSLGDEKRVQYVVQKAREYIESTNS